MGARVKPRQFEDNFGPGRIAPRAGRMMSTLPSLTATRRFVDEWGAFWDDDWARQKGAAMVETELGVGLADAIANVRTELERATTEGQASAIGFEPGPVELEFQVGFQTTKAGGGGVKVYVFTVDAKAEAVRSGTHRLKLTLTPARRAGVASALADKLIGDRGDE